MKKLVSQLGLSSQTYMFLVGNGVKTIPFLTTFTEEELKDFSVPLSQYRYREKKMELIKEIKEKLSEQGLSLRSTISEETVPLERKISEIGLSKRIVYRLTKSGICTVGALATKSERNILNIGALGKKALKEIQEVVETIPEFDWEMTKEEMVNYGMPFEEREYYQFQEKQIRQMEKSYKEEEKLRQDEIRRNADRKARIFRLSIIDLGIPEPIFEGDSDICTAKLTLGELLNYLSYKRIINKANVSTGLRRLNIPGIYIGMTRTEISDLQIPYGKLDELQELIRNERVRREEESQTRRRLLEEDTIRRQTLLVEQTDQYNESLRSQIAIKEGLIKKLEELLEEQKRLEEIDKSLGERMNGLFEKLGISTEESKGDIQNGK